MRRGFAIAPDGLPRDQSQVEDVKYGFQNQCTVLVLTAELQYLLKKNKRDKDGEGTHSQIWRSKLDLGWQGFWAALTATKFIPRGSWDALTETSPISVSMAASIISHGWAPLKNPPLDMYPFLEMVSIRGTCPKNRISEMDVFTESSLEAPDYQSYSSSFYLADRDTKAWFFFLAP